MLEDVSDLLADPVDGTALSSQDGYRSLVSAQGRSYEVCADGFVTLAACETLAHDGDDAQMVADRETFLSQGHYAPFVEAVTQGVHDALDDAGVGNDIAPALCEIGAGTGYYLSHTLDAVDDSRGVGIDVSYPAVQKLTTSHSRVGAVVADALERLPLRDECIHALTVIFAPHNSAEFARVLAPGGSVVVLNAESGHLRELREPLGIMDVEPGSTERIIEDMAQYFVPVQAPQLVEFKMRLDQPSIAAQIGMSPSARHIEPEVLHQRVATLPERMDITARASITRFVRPAE
ncbi:23S rRNA (guanine(748)-N(1))-methyltransferase [Corynebacterium ciconiae DSM 44920]|uniref:methyltransferase domain-containing protein n=1 Tax=Corynebacterium ciconiae TaxID=227319 RepID=UPI00036C869A|nr:methyltransferase domain-containing protein [Corynebacterium ciconiae]WKD60868.1 23S rRNA (guanine(748)-N(1))-methyltransferase [Corynebacterium ciconiae DSM 44920]